MKKRIAVAQLGARRHYVVPRALHEAGMLHTFYTDLASNGPPVSWMLGAVPFIRNTKAGRRMSGRYVHGLPTSHIKQYPLFGLSRVLGRSMRDDTNALATDYLRANQRFGMLVSRHGLGAADAVYGFNGAALEIFAKAKSLGLRTILDQTSAPIAMEEELLSAERVTWPGWEEEMDRSVLSDLSDREQAEWALADRIICGSTFVKTCVHKLTGLGDRCAVVPYGVKPVTATRHDIADPGKPLRVLYMGHARLLKGVQYFMRAAEQLEGESVECRVVGKVQVSTEARKQLAASVQLCDPVPYAQVGAQYEWADVLVVPSLSEGSANVAYEALSCGLPVIATENAGTVVKHEVDGLIIAARSGESIAEAIRTLCKDREKLRQFSREAATGAVHITPKAYAERLVRAVKGAIDT